MDTKKLLGTIIGVIMFALLIVGATYAWLTISANVTNGNYTVKTKNFIITYNGGSAITDTVQTSNATTANITSAASASDSTTDGWLAVTASKAATSAKASDFTIKLHVNSTTTIVSQTLTYAVCKGDCPTGVALATVDEVSKVATCASGVIACGTVNPSVKSQNPADIILYTDTSTFNVDGAVSNTIYNIYFWLDSGTLQNGDIGKIFSGYIHASATQGD